MAWVITQLVGCHASIFLDLTEILLQVKLVDPPPRGITINANLIVVSDNLPPWGSTINANLPTDGAPHIALQALHRLQHHLSPMLLLRIDFSLRQGVVRSNKFS
jgi:hypothetical protein